MCIRDSSRLGRLKTGPAQDWAGLRRGALAAPHRLAGSVEEDVEVFAPEGGEDVGTPALGSDQGLRKVVGGEPAHVGTLEGMGAQLTAEGPAVEDE